MSNEQAIIHYLCLHLARLDSAFWELVSVTAQQQERLEARSERSRKAKERYRKRVNKPNKS